MSHVAYRELLGELRTRPRKWLVTGAAGFIGSNLVQTLLDLDQEVVGLDNFATGRDQNLAEVRTQVESTRWARFEFIRGDIRQLEDCRRACAGVDFVLHQAALGSVPRSLHDPIATNATNVDGFLNMLVAARDAAVKSFTYAASSSTYGDHPGLPKVEERIGTPLSPYAVTKYVNELYAGVFARSYGFNSIGLRYFNVFGRRQDPNGPYAAVIPKWISAMIEGGDVYINGDGGTTRDFCFVDNAVEANLLAAVATTTEALNQIYNVAAGAQTTLLELFRTLVRELEKHGHFYTKAPIHREFRPGDVQHSLADLSKISSRLHYTPMFNLQSGIRYAMPWYLNNVGALGEQR